MNGIAAWREAASMNFKWVGPLALLAALVIGDQIRINRPGHKYRLTVEVETPEGVKSASGVMAVHPDRSYSRGGHTRTKGDAVFVDLGGGKNLVALLAHIDDKSVDLDGVNYVALRAYNAAGRVVGAQRHIVHSVEIDRFVVDMRQQGDKVLAAAEIDEHRIALGAGVPATAVTWVGLDRHPAGGGLAP